MRLIARFNCVNHWDKRGSYVAILSTINAGSLLTGYSCIGPWREFRSGPGHTNPPRMERQEGISFINR